MGERGAQSTSGEHDVQLWDPRHALKKVGAQDAALSCGFLRCRPEKWFPGFVNFWAPALHALGIEARLTDVRPLLPNSMEGLRTFIGEVAGEEITLSFEPTSLRALSEELVPGAADRAEALVLEYFVRRFFSSLSRSWSGGEEMAISFKSGAAQTGKTVACIKMNLLLNNRPVTALVGLGQGVVDTLDGLWRRQVQSLSKVSGGPASVRCEIAQLGIPPQMLGEYLAKGTVIDLEVPASEMIALKLGHRPWMPARMVDVGGVFGCEITPGALVVPPIAEGATKLSVELGHCALDGARIAELAQNGAVLVTNVPLSPRVHLVINEEKVADGRLCVYEGRFAVEVQ